MIGHHFDEREINEVNLSDWKAGGFLDWQARQDTLACAKELAEEAADIKAATPGGLADHLSTVLAARYAQLLNGWNGEVDEAFEKKLKCLRLMGQDIAVLRRGDLRAERLALEKEKRTEDKKTTQARALDLCLDEAKKFPAVAATFQKAFDLLDEVEEEEAEAGQTNGKTEARAVGPP